MVPVARSDKLILTLDQGTTGSRCTIFDSECNIISREYAEHRQIFPRPGWVEHGPLEIWEKIRLVIKTAMQKSRLDPKKIAAVGIANQRETVVVWEKKSLRPIYNAIVWQDARTSKRCADLLKDEEARRLISSKTGFPPYSYFSATKIEWILDHVPEARKKAERGELAFGNMDAWIICNLTDSKKVKENDRGSHVTDYTNASRTMLMDIRRLTWSDELLELFRIPEIMMPEIRPSSEIYGYVDQKFLGSGTPICGDLGDQQAALVGQVCFNKGDAKNTYGTGAFLLQNLGSELKFSNHGLLTTIAYGLEKGKCNYALEGSVAVAGAVVKWFKDNLGMINSIEEVEATAKSVGKEGSAGIYFVPAFTGLFAPHWDPYARGSMFGLTLYSQRSHLFQAALESICFQTRDVVEAMSRDTRNQIRVLKVDGGGSMSDYLMQLQSNLLRTRIVRPAVAETTSLGAAFAAGLAVGMWSGTKEIEKIWKAERIYKPKMNARDRDRLYAGWNEAIRRTKGWLSEIEEVV